MQFFKKRLIIVLAQAAASSAGSAQPSGSPPEDLASVRYANTYRECVMTKAVQMARGNGETADVVVKAASARCRQGDAGDILSLMRSAARTEAMRSSAAMFRSGVRGKSAAQITLEEAQSYAEFLDYVNGQALAAVLDARTVNN